MAVPLVRLASGQIREEPGTFSTIKTGELAGSATAVQMPDVTCYQVKFKALSDNAGNVYIGGFRVTGAKGPRHNTTGRGVGAGQENQGVRGGKLNVFFRLCTNEGGEQGLIGMD